MLIIFIYYFIQSSIKLINFPCNVINFFVVIYSKKRKETSKFFILHYFFLKLWVHASFDVSYG